MWGVLVVLVGTLLSRLLSNMAQVSDKIVDRATDLR